MWENISRRFTFSRSMHFLTVECYFRPGNEINVVRVKNYNAQLLKRAILTKQAKRKCADIIISRVKSSPKKTLILGPP